MGCHDVLAGAIRVILFGLNFSTLLAGGVLLGCGVYVKISVNEFSDVENVSVIDVAAYFLIALGCLVVVLSLFGCLGACLQNHVLLSLYFVFMLILLLAEIGIGILYAVEKSGIEKQIDDAIEDTIINYGDGTSDTDKTVGVIQEFFKCCGYNGVFDYNVEVFALPLSCCENQDPLIACTALNAYKNGCKTEINKFLASQSVLVVVVVSGVALLEILTMLAACYLRKRELDDVNITPYSM